MDLGFSTRTTARLRDGASPVRADHRELLAALAAMQGSRSGGPGADRPRDAAAPADARSSLVAILRHEAGWAEAARALGGSFDPRAAAAIAGKTRSTLMKACFTFAF